MMYKNLILFLLLQLNVFCFPNYGLFSAQGEPGNSPFAESLTSRDMMRSYDFMLSELITPKLLTPSGQEVCLVGVLHKPET